MKIRWIGFALLAFLGSCREAKHAAPASLREPKEKAEVGKVDDVPEGKSVPMTEWLSLTPEGEAKWEERGGGTVTWENGVLRLEWGEMLTAARWTGEFPRQAPYEIEWQARRVDGADFFSALTFPVRSPEECVTFVAGGWGGGVVGVSSVDGEDASHNETTKRRSFEMGRWYAFRLRVEKDRLQGWVDGETTFDLALEGKKLGLRPGPIEVCAPFGVASWQTTGELKEIRWRPLK